MRNAMIGCLAVVLVLIAVLLLVMCRARQETVTQQPVGQPGAASQTTIKIMWPQNGARVKVGQQFQVHAIATDPRGIFSIGIAVDSQPGTPGTASPPITTFSAVIPITFQTKGVHTIAVQANSTTGAKSEPATIQVVAAQNLSDPPSPNDPPTPLPPQTNPPPQTPPPPGATVNFFANPTSIQQGQCSTLQWDVDGVREVYFEGVGVTGHEQQQECPTQTTTYTLLVVFQDGTSQNYTVTISVLGGTAPAAPTNLRVTSTTTTSARLAWTDNATDETGFEIGIEGQASISAAANATQYEVTGLACRQSYNFSVRAVNAAGASSWSNTVSGQTATCDGGAPAAPTNLRVTSTTQTTARLAWTDNANNETGFEIGIEGQASISAAANATQYEVTGLACHQSYNFHVRAVNAAGNSAWSNVVPAQTAACEVPPPAAPTNLQIASKSQGKITLQWTDNSANEDGFEVQRVTDTSTGVMATVGANVKTATIDAPPCGVTFQYVVKAKNDAGYSSASNKLSVEGSCTPTPTATLPKPLVITGLTASISATKYSGPCPYQVPLSGSITASGGAGTVRYLWILDGQAHSVRELRFDGPGTKSVETGTWSVSNGTHTAQLKTTDPSEQWKQDTIEVFCSN